MCVLKWLTTVGSSILIDEAFPAGAGNISFHHRVQNSSETHPAPYPMDTGA